MDNKVLDFYEQIDTTRAPSLIDQDRITALLKLLEPQNSNVFLDIGCYDGRKSELLAQATGATKVYGLDFLATKLDQAQERGVEAYQYDLNAGLPAPFADETMDFIFVGDVIEHIFSPDFLLLEIKRLLRPGGYAILTTPNLASWRNRLILLLGWQPFMTEVSTQYKVGNPLAPQGMPSGHIRMFTSPALGELAGHYGLKVEYLAGQVMPHPPTSLLTRITHLVDRVCYLINSKLCDELVIKVRKPIR